MIQLFTLVTYLQVHTRKEERVGGLSNGIGAGGGHGGGGDGKYCPAPVQQLKGFTLGFQSQVNIAYSCAI